MYTTRIIMPKKMIDFRRFGVKNPLHSGKKIEAKSATTFIVPRVSPSAAANSQQLVWFRMVNAVRPFLIQSDSSVENGLFRLKQPTRAFLHSRKRAFSAQLFSTENSDWRIRSKKLDLFDWIILQSKNSVEKLLHVFF